MEKLIEALQILLKYGNPTYPTSCKHDTLNVHIDPDTVSEEDIEKLHGLSFYTSKRLSCFYSFRYGSA